MVHNIIEAIQWDGRLETYSQIREWSERRVKFVRDCLEVETLEGVMVANKGDWIIKGVQGEIYPCKPDIFEQTYEPAEPEDFGEQ